MYRFSLMRSLQIICLWFCSFFCWPLFANGWEHTAIPLSVLIDSLSDKDVRIRQQAAHSLGYHTNSLAAEALLATLAKGEESSQVRQSIFGALAKTGYPGALSVVRNCLIQEAEVSVRAACAAVLQNLPGKAAESMAILASQDKDRPVRIAAINSLGNHSSNTVVEILSTFIDSDDMPIRLSAIHSLGGTEHPNAFEKITALISPETDVATLVEALRASVKFADSRIQKKIQQVFDHTDNERVKRFALIALATAEGESNDIHSTLINALGSSDPLMIIQALEVIREMNERRLVAGVITQGIDFFKKFYGQSARQIAMHPKQAIIDLSIVNEYLRTIIAIDAHHGIELFRIAAKAPDIKKNRPVLLQVAQGIYQARWQATYGSGYTHPGEADDIIRRSFSSPDARLRAVATRSMGVNDPVRFYDLAIKALRDKQAEVRWQAAMVMGRNKTITDLRPLIQATRDTYSRVRREAVLSLGYIGKRHDVVLQTLQTMAKQDADADVKAAASYALNLLSTKNSTTY